ncbi:MAG: proton-conducting transporter membrane subunit [Caldilineaceae bacterium]
MFFLVGVIYERAHTRELSAFGGLAAKTPYFYGLMMVAAFASLGLPGGWLSGRNSSPSAVRLRWSPTGRPSAPSAS